MAAVVLCVSKHYNVQIVSREVVVSAIPMEQHILPLSNLDLALPPVSVHVFFCYKKPSNATFLCVLSHLKTSLSRALAFFYVFAGRLKTNSVGVPEVHCNNEGTQLTQAYAATAIAQLNLYNADESVQGKLVPLLSKTSKEDAIPVFAVQVTEFSCGGVVVGCTFDHRIADAYSANIFFACWANLSRNDSTVSLNPSFTRSILCPRDPPTYCTEIENLYVTQPSLESGKENPDPPALASRIYYLDAVNITKLQMRTNEGGKNYSKLEAFSAYLWKLLISTKKIKDSLICNIGIVVDGRTRLEKTGLSANYFGNVLSIPFSESSAYYIKTKSLSCLADLIHNAITTAANEEHFKSLIDLVETIKPGSILAKIYSGADDIQSTGPAVVVSSGLRFPLYEVDHGWGKPAFASYHFPWGGETGYVMPSPSPLGDGSWVVYIHLPLQDLHAIEADPSRILFPITQNFLAFA